MLFYHSNLLRVIARTIVAALLTTIVNPVYSQESGNWATRFKSSVAQNAPQAIKSAGKSFGALVGSTSSNLKTKVAGTISSISKKLKDSGPQAIIPMLQNALNSLGSKIGSVSSCMIGKGECSSKERAAFIGAAVVVLALTAILIGYTVTVAATSKEVDSQVVRVSQQVKGWSPEAVFARLNNVMADFRANLDAMKVCLIQRQCSKTQKRILYGSAATIAALATVAVGVGVGSYIYAEKNKAKQEQALRMLSDIEQAPAEQQAEVKPAFKLPDFDAMGTSLQAKLSGWQQKIKDKIPVVNSESLRNAYEKIKIGVMTGVITSKEMAADLFSAVIEQTKQFPDLLKETLGIDLAELNNTFTEFKSNLIELTKIVTAPVKYQLGSFADQMDQVIAYFQNLAIRAKNAKEAWDELSAAGILKAKIMSPEKYAAEKISFDQKTIELDERKNKAALLKPGSKAYNKELAAIAKEQEQLDKSKNKLIRMAHLDQFASYEKLNKLYPEIVTMINSLQLDIAGAFAEKLLGSLSKVLALSQTIHQKAGKIGAIIADPEIDQALVNLEAGIKNLGKHLNAVISVQPLIVTDKLDLKDLVKTVLQTLGGDFFNYMRNNARAIKDSVVSIKKLSDQIAPIQVSLELFTKRLGNLNSATRADFIDKLKANPLAGIAGAPALLRNALADAVRDTKVTFNNVLQNTTELLKQASIAVPAAYTLLNEFNDRIKEMTGKAFLNPKAIENMVPILTIDLPNLAEGAKGLMKGVREANIEMGS